MDSIWQRASEALSRFCEGRARTSIPARPDYDDDIAIADALNAGAALSARLAACEAERGRLRAALETAAGVPAFTCNACHNTTAHARSCPVADALGIVERLDDEWKAPPTTPGGGA